MTVNKPTNPRGLAAATLLVAAGAIAASLIAPTSIANANTPQQFYTVKGFNDCVDNARKISLPGYDDQALQASCCGSLGGFLFHGACVSTQNTAGTTTKPPGALIIAGHGPDPTRLNN